MVDTLVLGTSAQAWEFESLHAQFKRVIQFSVSLFQYKNQEFYISGIQIKKWQECINWCKNKNITQIELSVVEDNKSAIAMYESFGFKTTGTIPKAMHYQDGIYKDEKFMILEL